MQYIKVPFGSQELEIHLPESWSGEIVSPPALQPEPDFTRLVKSALDHPHGSPCLEHIARAGQRVAILVDDATRKTPVQLILPEVLDRLETAGVDAASITIVIALGSHRPMTPAEITARLGDEIPSRYSIVNTSAADHAAMVYLGSTQGIPAWVNRSVVEADLRIGLGMITPHMDAGFSGGAKIILPGVCSTQTVDAFHVRSIDMPGNPLGDINAPLRQELEQFVAGCIPLDFIVNAITTIDHALYQCVAGHFIAAHRAGVAHARTAFGAPVKRKYPLVIANCYPYDQDLWQSMKGLWSGELLTEDAGTLVLLTRASEGSLGNPGLPTHIGADPVELRRLIHSGEVLDPKEAATGIMVGRIKKRLHIALVSTGLTQDEADQMGFAYYAAVEDAVAASIKRLPETSRTGSIAVLSHAGMVLPLLPYPLSPDRLVDSNGSETSPN